MPDLRLKPRADERAVLEQLRRLDEDEGPWCPPLPDDAEFVVRTRALISEARQRAFESMGRVDPRLIAEIRIAGLLLPSRKKLKPPPKSRAGRPRRWSRLQIIAAMQTHAAKYGSQPRGDEWPRSTLDHPSANQVITAFGSWTAGLNAAGFRDGRSMNGYNSGTAKMLADNEARRNTSTAQDNPLD